MDDINKWGLFNSLIAIINEGTCEDTTVTIAKYLLKNYSRLHDLNIYDIAEECFVSRATIRRMAENLGFKNFKDMKEQFGDFDDYRFYYSGIDVDPFGRTMAEQLFQMAQECESYLTKERLEKIISRLNQSREIIFLTSDVYSRQSSEFQKAMILSGKMVRIVSNKYHDNSGLKKLQPEDMLVVVSISGFFAEKTLSMVRQLCGYKVLATTVDEEKYSACYDEIWRISDKPQVQKRTVYTIYALQFFLERISAAYLAKYNH